jgi:hypothetical protein
MKPDDPRIMPGAVVQLSPHFGNLAFACSFMTVTERKVFGAQGYVQVLGTREGPGGQAYYRANWDEMEYVGMCTWMVPE